MNINSLISNIAPLARGYIAPSPAKVISPAIESGQDTFTEGVGQNRTTPSVYTRASASGPILKTVDPTAGQPDGTAKGGASAEAGGQVDPENEQQQKLTPKDPHGSKNVNGDVLNSSERELLKQLQQVDQKVHTHEMAHLTAAGGYAKSGASYTYKRGPDGKNYAVGGEVQIDTSPEATPEATMAKMRIVRQAALAPADPSGQDQRVAAQASLRIAQAAQELVQIASRAQSVDQQSSSANDHAAGDGQNITPVEIYSQASSAVVAQPKSSHSIFRSRVHNYNTVASRQSAISQGLNLVA